MKIFHYNHSMYPPILDGSSNYILDIVASIQDYEFEILTKGLIGYPSSEKISGNTIIRRFSPKDFLQFSSKSQIRFFLLPIDLIFEWIRLWKEYKYMKNTKYDILQVHSIDAPISWLLCNKFKIDFIMDIVSKIIRFDKIKKEKILTIHGMSIGSNPLFDDQIKKLLKYSNNIVCVDSNVVTYIEELVENTGVKKIIYYVPNAVDTKKFNYFKKNRSEEKLIVGFVGRLEYSRGIDILVDLIYRLPIYIKLLVIGSGNENALNKFKNRIPLSKIDFYSNIPNNKIPEFIHTFDILFNPVLAEGISRITLESMSCGCPVIMIDKGNRYPLIHKKTGFLINYNLENILKTLEYIHNNMSVLDEMGIRARKIVELEFSIMIFAENYKKIYDKVLEENDKRLKLEHTQNI